MASAKETLLQQSTDMVDVKERIRKQGTIILEMQNDFHMALSNILAQIRILSPLQVTLGLPGFKSDFTTREAPFQACKGYQDPCT
jgi:hypothetical protein